MDKQQLQEQLDQLSQAIENLHAADEDKQQLVSFIQDIEQQLDTPLLADQSQSLADQLDTMVSTFEADHPTVATILNNIIVTLTSMGV